MKKIWLYTVADILDLYFGLCKQCQVGYFLVHLMMYSLIRHIEIAFILAVFVHGCASKNLESYCGLSVR